MRLGLDARYATDHFPGIGRYILGLAQGLAELTPGHRLVLIVNQAFAAGRYALTALADLPNVELHPVAVGPFSPQQQLVLPLLARQLQLDLLHSPYYVKPYVGLPCPSIVTIFDMNGWRFPRSLTWRGRIFYRVTMALAVRTSAMIITGSASAQADLRHVYRLPAHRLAVTPLAAERRFQPQPPEVLAAARARYQLPADYVLYVGSNKPHKNLERLVQAWARVVATGVNAATPLVLAGHEAGGGPSLRQLVTAADIERHVRFLPNIADDDLPALYSGATIFAFPSYYEGFGLPPLEAMACGTPVLCAYATSLPEVVGDAALTVDPFSMPEIAEGLQQLLANPQLRRDLSARGLQRARTFSWRRTALATLEVYARVMRETKRGQGGFRV
ncbi:MAG: glycosyltransferase family 1 protein [Candidatus Viridilinea halotolerans]|uniref:Glycosyltransferase family 1 protein n=1 Tax=Candidatus Viridilinea halotolerans TaxID=2491704 RepID=A0A426U004_9CHLR|nr:MAG: glycosyltransferase family 1 protein [Candidatus Viridilinea halotolerans]